MRTQDMRTHGVRGGREGSVGSVLSTEEDWTADVPPERKEKRGRWQAEYEWSAARAPA